MKENCKSKPGKLWTEFIKSK